MNKIYKNLWLFVSIGAVLLFVLTVGAYMQESPLPYPGPWPLVLISSTVVIALGTSLIFSVINLWKYKFHWQALVTILINAITFIPIGYASLIWMIVAVV